LTELHSVSFLYSLAETDRGGTVRYSVPHMRFDARIRRAPLFTLRWGTPSSVFSHADTKAHTGSWVVRVVALDDRLSPDQAKSLEIDGVGSLGTAEQPQPYLPSRIASDYAAGSL
jgi:hypothetical protein